MELSNSRVIIVDSDGKIFKYEWKIDEKHQDCFNKFVEEHHYRYSMLSDIVKYGNSVFYGLGQGGFGLYLTENRSEVHEKIVFELFDLVNVVGVKTYIGGKFVSLDRNCITNPIIRKLI